MLLVTWRWKTRFGTLGGVTCTRSHCAGEASVVGRRAGLRRHSKGDKCIKLGKAGTVESKARDDKRQRCDRSGYYNSDLQ